MKPYLGRRDPTRAATLVAQGSIRRAEACEGKAAHATQNDARHAAKLVFASTGHRCATYKCPFADHYHVTKLKHGEDAA